MRKSILLTACIAVAAIGLALALAQSEQIKGWFSDEAPTTQDTIADAVNPDATTVAENEATPSEQATDDQATPSETAADETVQADAAQDGAMTPVDLDQAAPAAGGEEAKTEEAAPASNYKVDVAAALVDHEIGSKSAPVTVYDFSSLTCPHCAHFHNDVLPKIKENYIDKGKVRWVFKGFPLNDPALRGEMLARCAPKGQYAKLEDLMYTNQERWAFDENAMANLSMLVRLAGVTDDMFTACTNNKELEEAMLKKIQGDVEKYDLKATPTFVFNDGLKTFSGGGTYEGFVYDLDSVLKQVELSKMTPAPAATSDKK